METSSQFTEREKEVAKLLLQARSNKQIAYSLGISKSTVEYHLKNIYRKLEVNSRAEAILNLSKGPLLESTGSQQQGNLWQSIGEISHEAEYSSQAKQFFDPKEEKAMKNRTMISISLSVIALAIALGAFAYLNFETKNSELLSSTGPAATPINTPRGVLQVPPEASTRFFDEVLLLLQTPDVPFRYAVYSSRLIVLFLEDRIVALLRKFQFPTKNQLVVRYIGCPMGKMVFMLVEMKS